MGHWWLEICLLNAVTQATFVLRSVVSLRVGCPTGQDLPSVLVGFGGVSASTKVL